MGESQGYNANGNYYMATYLKGVCGVVSVPIERLFIVPGNHDGRDTVGEAFPNKLRLRESTNIFI